jgi:hypothetical protein
VRCRIDWIVVYREVFDIEVNKGEMESGLYTLTPNRPTHCDTDTTCARSFDQVHHRRTPFGIALTVEP